ncbi:DUF3000 domain-containing protein [Bifidobacterium amazonense]|uniref:DUF3000 domain-containing protein n=1 Tax=Bifidobacterium amazonense TaxID=2809027 RepID=A0ABS9VW19_9BIFI|nr:DUF3000 family protein [Bifidobacterium amazonense]MCH9276293.1 DUF3000 domain-containing protein [Bifidobacterium amazonense]
MAEIFAFPAATRPGDEAVPTGRPDGVPDEMWHAVESVRAMRREPTVRYREMPVPESLADFGIGVELAAPAAAPTARGWIMLLYSRAFRVDWQSRWRCVAFAAIPLETRENDGLAPAMYWDDMCGHLRLVRPASLGGTVTVTQSTSFGTLEGETSVGCEMRVSWTPLEDTDGGMDAGDQIRSWARFVGSAARDEEDPTVER